MTKQHLRDIVFRYFLFLLGIFTISLGIAFSTSSGLGTTPLASLPYTLSLGFAPSMGTFMMLLNITCFLIQLALLRKRFPKAWVLQLPAAVIFGLSPQTTGCSLPAWQRGLFWLRRDSVSRFRQTRLCCP